MMLESAKEKEKKAPWEADKKMWHTTPVEKKENRSDIRCNGTDTREERKKY